MALTLDQLVTALTEDEVLETMLAALDTLGVPARSWRKAGALRSILRVCANSFAQYSQVMAAFAKSGFLDYATADWLTLLAKQGYSVDRIPATYAAGNLTLTNAGGGVYTFAAGECRALWTISATVKRSYRNTAGFTINPGQVLTIAFEAIELGTASAAPAASITDLETAAPGVTLTNPTAFSASDAQGDDDLRTVCRNKLGALSPNGPGGAYDYAIAAAKRPTGDAVNINRYSRSPSSSTGVVDVYLASPAGVPDPLDVGYVQTSIAAIAQPDTVTVNVNSATAVAVTKTITVWARAKAGVAASDITAAVNTALNAYISTYPIGGIAKSPATQGYLWSSGLEGVVKSAHDTIFAVDGFGADVALNAGRVATLSTTITMRLV